MIYPIKHSNSTNYLCSLDTLIFVYCIWPAVQTHHSFHPFSHLFQHYLLISDRHKFSSLISIHDIAQCLLAYCYGDSIPFFVFLLHCSSFLMASNLNISHHFQGPFWWVLPYYHLFYRWWWSVRLTSLPKFSSFQLSFLFSGSEESVKAEQNPCEHLPSHLVTLPQILLFHTTCKKAWQWADCHDSRNTFHAALYDWILPSCALAVLFNA